MRFVGIDPSTKTGFVALDLDGKVMKAKELTGIGKEDPKRMATMIDNIMSHMHPGDSIVIEGFGFNSQQAIQLGGIGWGIRMALLRRGMDYTEVAPNAVKKFVNVTGWIGDPGKKRRLKGKEKKQVVMEAVQLHFGFSHKSDNVVDAYIMAQIARHIYTARSMSDRYLPAYQAEVLESILHPKKKVKLK
ncbi:hypothetical protein [Heyndrickxia acidiproducens]|uniref:hypothetical protein n=1 Tax=Heyndrickxia acidiproducens TaxID=1121084 RepID=UPI000368A65A|nr:hypothetical protein [Heyndrickxia acidiproducens]